ncbi:hypothetical protein OIU79_006889 [Salix purpurea]|uniref:Uncharacterized protein n=1 Tax=Salix purpurea TaxID=77065 RepID=A0A9Q0Z2Q1_SALPP|nr:hypothetical protein OIU79_006889 [Salix purpurea]
MAGPGVLVPSLQSGRVGGGRDAAFWFFQGEDVGFVWMTAAGAGVMVTEKRIAGKAGLGDVSWRKLRLCGEQWCLSVFWLWTKRLVVWVIGAALNRRFVCGKGE